MNELEKIAELTAEIAKTQARADLLRVERAKVMAAATKSSSTHVIGATAGMSHVGVLRAVRESGPGTPRAKEARATARKLGVSLSA
jgi:hypothetical protein